MAREILFKAKRLDNGEWVYGNYAFEDTKGERHFIFQNFGFEYEVDKDTICQYTGLTDKNGRNIFENDVIKKHFYTDYDNFCNSREFIGKVEYDDCAWCIKAKMNDYKYTHPIFMALSESHDAEYYEVIGNIFDNPELLGGADNG